MQWSECIYFVCLRSNIRSSCKLNRVEDMTFLTLPSVAPNCLPQPPKPRAAVPSDLVMSRFTAPEVVSVKGIWFIKHILLMGWREEVIVHAVMLLQGNCNLHGESWWAVQDWLTAVLFPDTCSHNSMSCPCLTSMNMGCHPKEAGGIQKMGSQVDVPGVQVCETPERT